MIQLRNLDRVYPLKGGPFYALRNITLSIEEGDFVSIMGPTGYPAVLLADEPTGNLDSKNGDAVMELLQSLHRTGSTIPMVTHDTRFARHADRMVHLFDGRLVEESVENKG